VDLFEAFATLMTPVVELGGTTASKLEVVQLVMVVAAIPEVNVTPKTGQVIPVAEMCTTAPTGPEAGVKVTAPGAAANAGAAGRATPAIVRTRESKRKRGDREVRSRQLNLPRFDDNSTSPI